MLDDFHGGVEALFDEFELTGARRDDVLQLQIGGFADAVKQNKVHVKNPEVLAKLSEEKRTALIEVLEQDPRPAYQNDPERVYGFPFAEYEVKFKVIGNELEIVSIK